MNKQEKTQEIDSLRGILKDAPPTFVLAYRGLTVNQVATLRKKVRASQGSYKVVKNRLALRVIDKTPLEPLKAHFKGPTAIAYAAKDPAALAKVLEEFAKDNQGLTVKAGFVDGRVIDVQSVKALAALPSREVLVSRLLGALNAPATRMLSVMQGTARNLVRTLDQIAKKKGKAPADAAATGE